MLRRTAPFVALIAVTGVSLVSHRRPQKRGYFTSHCIDPPVCRHPRIRLCASAAGPGELLPSVARLYASLERPTNSAASCCA